jgi:hypothetical protein
MKTLQETALSLYAAETHLRDSLFALGLKSIPAPMKSFIYLLLNG